jgi:hypothetical protein
VSGAIYAGGNIQCNAVFAANSTTLLLRPNGASVSSGQLSIDTSGNVNAEGIIGTSASSMRVTNTNGGFLIYKDATPTGAARFTYNTAAANTISLGVYDGASWTDPFRVTTTQALVTTTTASTGTSSGALVVSGGVGVAKSINAGEGGSTHNFTGGDGGSGSTIFTIKDYAGTTKVNVDGIGGVGIGASLVLSGSSNVLRIVNSQTPASASATGAVGTIAWDSSYIYVCTATNTWKRAAISTW